MKKIITLAPVALLLAACTTAPTPVDPFPCSAVDGNVREKCDDPEQIRSLQDTTEVNVSPIPDVDPFLYVDPEERGVRTTEPEQEPEQRSPINDPLRETGENRGSF